MISHRFVLGHAAGVAQRRCPVMPLPNPLFHLDAAVMTVAPALLLRAVAAIGERFSASRDWDEMRALQATVFDFMGATLTMLWRQPPNPRDREHRARLGWGVPPPEWAPQFELRFGSRLVELYGSTEVGAISARRSTSREGRGPAARCSIAGRSDWSTTTTSRCPWANRGSCWFDLGSPGSSWTVTAACPRSRWRRFESAIAQTCENIQRITRDIVFGHKLVVGTVHGYAGPPACDGIVRAGRTPGCVWSDPRR
jgi:hypothetical protein